MRKQQQGFTLIELVVIIIILGILSATALPKFTNLSEDAEKAQVKSVAAAITAWGQSNYATRKLDPTKGLPIDNGTSACSTSAGGLLATGTFDKILDGSSKIVQSDSNKPNEFYATAVNSTADDCSKGAVIQCNIINSSNAAATAVAYVPCTNQ